MKKILLTLITIFIITLSANAQEKVIKLNPVGLAFGTGKITFENVMDVSKSTEVSITYSSLDLGFFGKSTGIGTAAKYKFYLSKKKEAPKGLYLAPEISYSHTKYENLGIDFNLSLYGGALLFGHQWILFGEDKGLAIDLNFGVGYYYADIKGPAAYGDGILPRGNLSFGYAF